MVDGGPLTTVQDVPGRVGYWHVGVPPSGPMDDLSHRLVNRVVGNDEGAAALEMTTAGPTLAVPRRRRRRRRRGDARRPSTAPRAAVDAGRVPAGATVAIGAVDGPGMRAALAVRGRARASYLGSRSDVHARRLRRSRGRALRAGDELPSATTSTAGPGGRCRPAWPRARPTTGRSGCSSARTAPEFLTHDGLDALLAHRVGGALQLGPHRRAPDRTDRRWARPTAATPACTRRTSTTPATPSAPSTSPATCRSSSVPTGRAWAGSSARRGRRRPSGGSSASSAGRPGAARAVVAEQTPPTTRRAERGIAAATDRSEPAPARREPCAAPVGRRRRSPGGRPTAPGVTYRQAGDRFLLVEYGADGARPRAAPGSTPSTAGCASTWAGHRRRHAGVRSLLVQVDGDG